MPSSAFAAILIGEAEAIEPTATVPSLQSPTAIR
jgi:hypothetical protein